MLVVALVGELGLLEVQVEVQIRGGHRCSLDPNSFLMARRRKLKEELWHLSLRRRWVRTWAEFVAEMWRKSGIYVNLKELKF